MTSPLRSPLAAGPPTPTEPALTDQALLRFQEHRLRALIRHACSRVPFYRDRFAQAALHPQEIQGVAQLSRIPVCERDELQTAPVEALLADGLDPRALVMRRTSGSTGAPLTVYRTRFEERLLQSVRLRRALRFGLRPRDLRVHIATPQELVTTRPGERARTPIHKRLGLLRQLLLDCRDDPEEMLRALRRAAPRSLSVHGYTASIAQVATLMTEEDRRLLRPRFVTGGAETLTALLRRQIERGFDAPFYDQYGSNEFNLIAGQLHRTSDLVVPRQAVLVEVLRDGRPVGEGEEGELVATALHSFAMPIIRYRLGDVVIRGVAGDPAGLSAASLRRVRGRSVERMVLPGGATLHPYALVDELLEHAPWVGRYRIVQAAIDRLRVRVVPLPGAAPRPPELTRLERRLLHAVGERVTLQVELVEELRPGAHGKHRPFVSLVASRPPPR